MRTLTMREWQIIYREWRKQYAHLPKRARGWIVRGCRGKALYETKEEAEGIAASLDRRGTKMISIYPCDVCAAWHIGNTDNDPGRPNRLEV
jgi:hypothetical protein